MIRITVYKHDDVKVLEVISNLIDYSYFEFLCADSFLRTVSKREKFYAAIICGTVTDDHLT